MEVQEFEFVKVDRGTEFVVTLHRGTWQESFSRLKVMAVADGYIVARYKGCAPFVENLKEFKRRVCKDTNKDWDLHISGE